MLKASSTQMVRGQSESKNKRSDLKENTMWDWRTGGASEIFYIRYFYLKNDKKEEENKDRGQHIRLTFFWEEQPSLVSLTSENNQSFHLIKQTR